MNGITIAAKRTAEMAAMFMVGNGLLACSSPSVGSRYGRRISR